MNQITDNIWLGNSQDARDAASLRAAGITAILNCAVDLPAVLGWREGFKHYHVGLMDGPGNSPLLYDAAIRILYSIFDTEKTLVHCHEGKSRSAFIVAATLADKWHEGNVSLMLPQMVSFIQEKRPIVQIHPSHFETMPWKGCPDYWKKP